MVIRSSVDNILISTNGTNGQPGAPGTSSYIHIKYSNDGGVTFTANDGETIGAYIGIYKDYVEEDSDSVSDYQWKKIEGEDGESAYTVMLSNENFSISTDTSYVPIHTQSFTCNVTVLKGGSPESFTITASTDTENDIVTTVNGHAVNITVAPVGALSATQGVITLTISTTEGHSFTKDITWSVAVQGTDGEKGDTGDDGRGVVSITEYFLLSATDNASQITFPEVNDKHGWTTVGEALIWSKTKPYLWHCTEVVYENPSSTVYIDKYCDTSWKAADLVQANLTDFQTGVDNVIDRDNQAIRSAVWENTYTYKPKKDAQGNYMYDGNGKIIPDVDTATKMSSYMAEQILNMEGITSRVASTETDINGIDGRLSTAESTITQHADEIELKVSKDGVISSINQSAEEIQIEASRVAIDGTAIFNDSDFQAALDADIGNTIISSVTLYYASNSTSVPDKPTSHIVTNDEDTYEAWNIALPEYSTSYPYLYICTENRTKDGTYSWTSVEQNTYVSAISSIKSTADAASPKSSAIARSQRIYYRKTTSGAPSKNTTWLATSGTGYGNWSLSVPQLTDGNGTKYLYLYTAVQTQTVAQQAAGNTCTCSDVLIDDTATIIDGGTIITGTVTAREITTDNLQGDHGWINLKDGKFYYGDNATFDNSTNAISWNGSKLQIRADEFLLTNGKTIFDEIEAIETWFYNTAPTTSNAPASSWTTDNLKEMHLRDIYFDTSTGKSYRWAIDGTTYKWVEIEDKELSALAGRVSTAETNISSNTEQIALRATKTEVANTYATKEYADDAADTAEANAKSDTATKLQSYYTKTETDSAISQTAEGITTRVTKLETRTVGNYATSSTDAGITDKVATIVPAVTGWELYKGAVMTVKFTAANTASAPTLNVNSTGAKPIKTYSGGNLSEAEYKWDAGSTMSFVYDGTNWRIQDSTELTNIKKNQTQIEQTATSITSLAEGGDTYTKPDGTTGTNTLKSLITQTATSIESVVAGNDTYTKPDGTTGTNTLKSMIDQTADSITSLVEGNSTYTTPDGTTAENKLTTMISQNAGQIALKANSDDVYTKTETDGLIDDAEKYADDAVESFSSQFTLTPSEISSEVTALKNGSEISSRINQTANEVKIKASKVEIDGAAIFNNSDFREAADEAYDAKGTAEEVISNLEIGGRNLLLDTNTSSLNKVSSNVDRYWSNAETLSDDGNAEFVEITDSPTNGIRYGIQLSSTGNAANSHALAFYKASLADRFRFEVGQTYTLSCYVKHISGSDSDVFINIGSRTAMGIWDYATFTLSSESDSWMKVAWTFKPIFSSNGRSIDGSDDGVGNVVIAKTEEVYSTDDDNGNVTIYTIIANDDGEGNVVILKEASDEDPSDDSRIIYFGMDYSDACTIQMCGFKLEKGNFATDWTPAPEDIDSAIADVKETADAAAPKSSAIAEEQRIYYRSKVSTKPSGNALPSIWITNTGDIWNDTATVTAANSWTRKITPIGKNGISSTSTQKYLYLWTCIQKKTVSGDVTYTDILLDESTTVIDGGNIITGTVTANQIDVTNLFAQDITATNLKLTNNNGNYMTKVDSDGIGFYLKDMDSSSSTYGQYTNKLASFSSSGFDMYDINNDYEFHHYYQELDGNITYSTPFRFSRAGEIQTEGDAIYVTADECNFDTVTSFKHPMLSYGEDISAYRVGDTISINGYVECVGRVAAGGKTLAFQIPITRTIKKNLSLSLNCDDMALYYGNGSVSNTLSDWTVNSTTVTYDNFGIRVTMTRTNSATWISSTNMSVTVALHNPTITVSS